MDITRKSQIKQTALLLTLVYFFLSSYMMIGVERHVFEHENHAHHDHAAQHASLICAWMCAASTFVQSANPNFSQSSHPTFNNPTVYIELFSNNLSVFSFYIRPPPVILS